MVGKNIPYTLQVYSDDASLIMEQKGSSSVVFPFSRKFSEGEYHKITAQLVDIGGDDYLRTTMHITRALK